MVDVQGLLKEYRQEYDLQMPAIRKLEEALLKRRERLDALEKEIKAVVMTERHSERGFGVSATFRSGYVRNTWDNDKLEGYAVAFPGILEFRKQTDVGPSVSMKVNENR